MTNYETKLLLVLTIASLVMLAISLWMAWSVWRVVRRLVAYVGDHMDGLIRKQGEVLQEVASVATAEAESKRIEQAPETGTRG
jgi:hypothetical protein